MPHSHPLPETLSAYASGTLSEGMELLVSSHMTYCATCRNDVAALENLGGALIEVGEGAAMDAAALDNIFAALEMAEPIKTPVPFNVDETCPLPAQVQAVLDTPFDQLPWQFRLPGLHEYRLSGFEGETVSLLRGRPGATMLSHTHEGEEATMIFTGAMEDDGVIYCKGDVAEADHSHDHKPKIVGDEICYCLIVISGGMKFTGTFSRALNLFRA